MEENNEIGSKLHLRQKDKDTNEHNYIRAITSYPTCTMTSFVISIEEVDV